MKFLVIFLSIVSVNLASNYIEPGEVTIDNFDIVDSKIASGVAAKRGENLDFCYLSINFFQKRQTCGCFILSPTQVVTSARCVVDCSEKLASNVTVTFPQKRGRDAIRQVSKIIVPDGINGDGALEKYDETLEVPFTAFHAGSNVAILELESSISLDGRTARSSDAVEESTVEELLSRNAEYRFRACGIGAIDNVGLLPRGVVCTDINLVPSDRCLNPQDPTEAYIVPETFACVQWPSMDNNLCAGDYGGPLWIYQLDPRGNAINQDVFCISVGSPDLRKNANCLGGHTTFCQFWNEAVWDWLYSFYPSSSRFKKGKKGSKKFKG